ncbi:MAG: nuclease A inhibitor family protein [Blastocatellia bacterium]|nr:nuclease A inhibitor family protein [Blastocatellia bacterium]
MNTNETLQTQLEQAMSGLLFQSESDFPFEVVSFGSVESPLSVEALCEWLQLPAGTTVETLEAGAFFKPLGAELNWYGNEERETAARYRELFAFLTRNLTDLRVFRIGEVNLSIFILGKTPDQQVWGLKTQAVET